MVDQLQIIPQKCTGCRQCELACSWVQTGTFQPTQSLIRVFIFDEEASYSAYTCAQCSEAWCMNVCPVNAIYLDQRTGAKQIDHEVCVGCHLCTLACPFGTVFTQPSSGRAIKCDLCGGQPACLASCPTNAIELLSDAPPSGLSQWAAQVSTGRTAILTADSNT